MPGAGGDAAGDGLSKGSTGKETGLRWAAPPPPVPGVRLGECQMSGRDRASAVHGAGRLTQTVSHCYD